MKYVAVIIIFASTIAYADKPLEIEPFLCTGNYEELVIYTLEEAYKEDVRVRVLVVPSFSPEYAVGIRENSGIFTIFRLSPVKPLWGYRRLEMMRANPPMVRIEGVWVPDEESIKKLEEEYPGDCRDIKIERCEIQINSDLAKSIIEIWEKMLLQTRDLKNSRRGLDGTVYHFSMSVGRQKFAGSTWSPSTESKAGKLVAISSLMAKMCITDKIEIEKKLKSRVKELKEQLLDYE